MSEESEQSVGSVVRQERCSEVCTRSLLRALLTLVTRLSLHIGSRGAPVTEIYFLVFRETKAQRARPALAASPVILVQNNQYAIIKYLGAGCSGPWHCWHRKKSMCTHTGGCFVAGTEELTERGVQPLRALKGWGMLTPPSVTGNQHPQVAEVKHRAQTRPAGQSHTPDLKLCLSQKGGCSYIYYMTMKKKERL